VPAFVPCAENRNKSQNWQAVFCDISRKLCKLLIFSYARPNIFLVIVAIWGKSCAMPRKKIGLEQRLNFWVGQETYDFYSALADKRGEKISELLRHVLDRAQKFFDQDGNYLSDLPMSPEQLREMMREVAREESRKVLEDPIIKKNLEDQWETRPGQRESVEKASTKSV